ncbi:MAG: hypothetical protein HPKKFMNG_00509 [Planctomycetes bacterium]|nr:hypothetical protein [Planctomycetota bacterium]
MTTSSVSVPPRPSLTVRRKVSGVAAETLGAVKDGVAVEEPLSETVGLPAIWTQEKLRASPSGSLLRVPLRLAVLPSGTFWSVPALAWGGLLGAVVYSTVTTTSSLLVPPRPSLAVTLNVNWVLTVTEGAVNVGVAVAAPLSAIVGAPATCVHA